MSDILWPPGMIALPFGRLHEVAPAIEIEADSSTCDGLRVAADRVDMQRRDLAVRAILEPRGILRKALHRRPIGDLEDEQSVSFDGLLADFPMHSLAVHLQAEVE